MHAPNNARLRYLFVLLKFCCKWIAQYCTHHWQQHEFLVLKYEFLLECKNKRTVFDLISTPCTKHNDKVLMVALQEAFQRHFLGFWHRYSKSGEVGVRVVLLEEAIKEEEGKLAKLDEQLDQTRDPQRTHPSPEHASDSVVDCNNAWEQR